MPKNLFLKALRVAAGKTQYDCAAALKVSPASYQRVEAGQATLTNDGWKSLAKLINVPVETLTDKSLQDDHTRLVNRIAASSKPARRGKSATCLTPGMVQAAKAKMTRTPTSRRR